MPCNMKDPGQIVTVDLDTFQVSVIFTPDTKWRYPGMFTVDNKIYAIYSSYTLDGSNRVSQLAINL